MVGRSGGLPRVRCQPTAPTSNGVASGPNEHQHQTFVLTLDRGGKMKSETRNPRIDDEGLTPEVIELDREIAPTLSHINPEMQEEIEDLAHTGHTVEAEQELLDYV